MRANRRSGAAPDGPRAAPSSPKAIEGLHSAAHHFCARRARALRGRSHAERVQGAPLGQAAIGRAARAAARGRAGATREGPAFGRCRPKVAKARAR